MKVISESAFNHNGDVKNLISLAIESEKSGADYFTFQVMDVDDFCTKEYSKYELYAKYSLSFEEFDYFFDSTRHLEIEYIPCVLDVKSLNFILSKGFKFIKIHATDISNLALLNCIASNPEISVILETQCATHFDISLGLNRIGKQVKCLMHGFSNYPTEVEDLQLNSLDYLKDKFKMSVGFADHSLDVQNIPLMALAKNCAYLEKHITLSRNNRHLDYQVSLYPEEFAAMTATLRHYSTSLGSYKKHPTLSELNFRQVMYKKEIGDGTYKRSSLGNEYTDNRIQSFKKDNVGIALIARLKSQRLEKKVLKPFHESTMIAFLYERLSVNNFEEKIFLSTSDLSADDELCLYAQNTGMKVFRGHAESVIDRMLSLAFREELGAVFRVTGDNPLTDPRLMEEMVDLYLKEDLDYVRVENLPFGVSAELFSTKYLWNLYLNLSNPMYSEYLTWYVLKDETARKGVISIISDTEDVGLYNLSVDYQEDYLSVIDLISEMADPISASTSEIIKHLDKIKKVDTNKFIKLPHNSNVKFEDYYESLRDQKFHVRKSITI